MSNALLDEEIRQAIGAHGAWKLKLSTAINTGHSNANPDELECDTCCAFGKWLSGPDLDAGIRAGKPYQVTARLHREFHQHAADVLRRATTGDMAGARAAFDGAYKEKSETLMRALTKWRQELRQNA